MALRMDWANIWLQLARFTEENGCLASAMGALLHTKIISALDCFMPWRHLTQVPQPRCGALIDMKPFHKKVDEGMDPEAAWQEAKAQVEKKVKYGTWATDFFVSGPEESARFCHIDEIR